MEGRATLQHLPRLGALCGNGRPIKPRPLYTHWSLEVEELELGASHGNEQQPYCQFILELLRFILYHSIFIFQDQHYLQVQGVVMGTLCAPSFASLYLGGGSI